MFHFNKYLQYWNFPEDRATVKWMLCYNGYDVIISEHFFYAMSELKMALANGDRMTCSSPVTDRAETSWSIFGRGAVGCNFLLHLTTEHDFENLWGLYLSGGPLPVCSLGSLPAKPGVVVESEDDDVSAKVEIEEEVVDETAAVVATWFSGVVTSALASSRLVVSVVICCVVSAPPPEI